MGLDSYAYAVNTATKKSFEIAYWRRHNALHGWMENLWVQKGRPNNNHLEEYDYFNGIPLELNEEDIDLLEHDVLSDSLPVTDGFFFVEPSELDDFKKEQTLKFIGEARIAFGEGKKVYYDSSW